MAFTETEAAAIFNAFWEGRENRCPKCSSLMKLMFEPYFEGYSLTAYCRRGCGLSKFSREDDPQRCTFRAWTDQEKQAVIASYCQSNAAFCPVDKQQVTVVEEPQSTEGNVTGNTFNIHCNRCGGFLQETIPMQP